MKESSIPEINPKIPGIIIISHGDFALGVLNSAKMICGEIENIVALGIEPNDDIDKYKIRLSELISLFPEGIFALVDITSGTPFNSLMDVMNGKKLYGIAGINLPLVIDVALMRETNTLEEISIAAEKSAYTSICNLGRLQSELLSEV